MSGPSHRPGSAAIVQACGLLQNVEPEHLDRLIQNSRVISAAKGETIWIAGEQSNFGAILGAGFVKMSRSTPQGTEIAVELLGPGQGFGIMTAIEGNPFPLSATAITACWYLRISRTEIQRLFDESSVFKDRIVRHLGPRLRKAHEMMSRLSSGRVEQRIAAVLLMLAESYGHATDQGVELDVPLTRTDLAELAGTTTETAIRTLSRWQKDGFVATEHQVITILSEPDLKAVLI